MNEANPQPSRDLRLFLQETYLQRLRKNPRYSVRAYARSLGLNSGTLSQLMNGRRPLTGRTREKIVASLGLDPQEALSFLAPSLVQPAGSGTSEFNHLSVDTFAMIADWYHYAILELTRIKGFRPNVRWVARKLGITVAEAGIAVQRLQRLGFLKIESGKWRDVGGNLTNVPHTHTAGALKRFQNQVLEMAIRANNELPLEARDQTSLTVSVDRRALPEIKEKIKTLRRELDRFIEARGEPDAVYHLCISFYPVTKHEELAK